MNTRRRSNIVAGATVETLENEGRLEAAVWTNAIASQRQRLTKKAEW